MDFQSILVQSLIKYIVAPTVYILFELTKPFEIEIEKQISNYGISYMAYHWWFMEAGGLVGNTQEGFRTNIR